MKTRVFDVIGLGNCAADFLGIIPYYPALDERVQIVQLDRQGGGEAATAIVTLARLGASTSFVGKIGDDDLGRFIKHEFETESVDTSHLVIEKGKTSLFAFCAIDQGSGRKTIFWHKETSPLNPEDLDRNFITSTRILHLDQRELKAGFTAAAWAKKSGILVSVDIDDFNSRLEKLIKITDIFIGSQKCKNYFANDPWEASEKVSLLGPKIVVFTLGERGCFIKSIEESFMEPAFEVKVVDTTGAGDVFHGAFIYGLLQNWSLRKIARFANATSAIKCTKIGGRSGIPTLKEVTAFLKINSIF